MKKLLLLGVFLLFLMSGFASANWSSTKDTILAYEGVNSSDTNGDGKHDTLYVAGMVYDGTENSGEGICLALDGATGAEIWRRTYVDADGVNKLNPIELYDVTGDGVADVFTHWGAPTGAYQIGFICFNGLTGETVWENRDYRIRPAWHHFVIVCDKETDIPYIIFNSHPYETGGPFYMRKLDARTGQEVKSIPSGGTCNGGVSAADLEGDGDVEFIIGLHSPPGFVCYNDELEIQWQSGVDTQSSTQCPSLVDVTGPISGQPDGVLDVVSLVQTSVGGTNGGITVADGRDGSVDNAMSAWNLGFGYGAHGQGSVADFDLDGYYEITSAYADSNNPQNPVIIEIRSPPKKDATLPILATNPPKFIDITGDAHFELICHNFAHDQWGSSYVHDWQTYEVIPGFEFSQWGYKLNDIDGDGLAELFGPRNGQITCYDTNKPAPRGINTWTAHSGYRRLASTEVYEPCPGTWWYSWDDWENAHSQPPPDVICWKCDNGNAISTNFPDGTTCGEGIAQNYPYQTEPDCSEPEPPDICYKCINGRENQMQVPAGDPCPDGWSKTKPDDCSEPIPGFEIFLLIFALIFVFWRRR